LKDGIPIKIVILNFIVKQTYQSSLNYYAVFIIKQRLFQTYKLEKSGRT